MSLLLLSDAPAAGPAPDNNVTAFLRVYRLPPAGLMLSVVEPTEAHFVPPALLKLFRTAAPALRGVVVTATSGNSPSPDAFVRAADRGTTRFSVPIDKVRFE